MKKQWNLIWLLAIVSIVECFFIPDLYEVTYDYEAQVSSFVEKPRVFTSSFWIKFQLTVTNSPSNTLVHINNVTYSFFSGNVLELDPIFLAIPEEAKHIQLPFIIKRNNKGQSVSILTKKDDSVWSVDLKKGIASLLQLDTHQINVTNGLPYGFKSDEFSVYGSCPVAYSVIPHSKDDIRIVKRIEPTSCEGFNWKANYNLNTDYCEKPYVNPISITSTHNYEMEMVENNMFVNRIESTNSIILTTFDGNSDGYSMEIRQYLSKSDEKIVQQYPSVHMENMVEHKLKPSFVQQEGEGNIYDLIGDRGSYAMESIPDKIIQGYRIILKHLDDEIKISYDNNEETVHFVIQLLRIMDRKHLDIMFNRLKSDTREKKIFPLFMQSIPMIGTKTAAIFIRDLIINQKVNSGYARLLIGALPFYIKHPNKNVLRELMVLSNVTDPSLKNTIILSLGSIISKVVENHPADPGVLQYIDNFIEKFKSSTDEDERYLYLGALHNMRSGRVVQFLEHVIANDGIMSNLTPYLRSLAIMACREFHTRKPNFELYWSILSNYKENLEVKAAALNTIMRNPSMETLLGLKLMFFGLHDTELYALFYTNLKSIEKSTSPCYEESASHARKLLKISALPVPRLTNSFDRIFDFLDQHYKFGMLLRTTWVGDLFRDNFTTIRLELSAQVTDFNLNQEIHYVRLAFKDEEACRIAKKRSTLYRSDSNLLNIIDFLNSNQVRLNINILTLRNNRVSVISRIENGYDDLPNILDYLKQNVLFATKNTNIYKVFGLKVDGETVFPTDLGTPAMLFIQMATTYKQSHNVAIKDNFLEGLTYDFIQLSHQVYGLKAYNPIVDTWHGVRRNHISDTRVPLNVTATQDGNDSIVMQFYNVDNEKIKPYKYESNIFSQVFVDSIEDNQKKIEQVCPKCKAYNQVTYGLEHRKNKVLWEYKCELTNMVYQLAVFDCERPLTTSRTTELKQAFFGNQDKNYGNSPWLKILMTMRHVWAFMITSPAPGRCGFRLTATPAHTHGFMAFNIDRPMSMHMNFFNGSEDLKSWSIEMDKEMVINGDSRYFVIYSQTAPSKQICIEDQNDFLNSSLKHRFIVFTNGPNQEKCSFDSGILNISVIKEFNEKSFSVDAFNECFLSDQRPAKCLSEQLIHDTYSYDIDYKKAPDAFINAWKDFADEFRNDFGRYSFRRSSNGSIENGKLNIAVNYETRSKEPNVHLVMANDEIVYKNIPIDDTIWEFVIPNSHVITTIGNLRNLFVQYEGICEIRDNVLTNVDGYLTNFELTSKWKNILKQGKTVVNVRRGNNTPLELQIYSDFEKEDRPFDENEYIFATYSSVTLMPSNTTIKENDISLLSYINMNGSKIITLELLNPLYFIISENDVMLIIPKNDMNSGFCY